MQKSYFKISNKSIDFLRKADPKLGRLIALVGVPKREIISDPFTALIQSIVFQQLAYAAANTIWGRFLSTVGSILPTSVINTSDSALRACGLSGTKVQYVKNIAQAFLNKTLTNEKIFAMSDDEIVAELVKIKGVGIWTAQMFLIFCLGRQNVFSYKDLGLRRGIQWLYELDEEPGETFCNAVCARWSPFGSVASLCLWEITIQNLFATSSNEVLYNRLNGEPMHVGYFNSPIGILRIATSSKGLERLEFVEKREESSKEDTALMKEVKMQLSQYFSCERKAFDLPLNLIGTPFQKKVWQALCTIPYGLTRSYGQLAALIGNDKASRAVGGANNKNKIAIVVPCHRVVGADGSLTGYAGGLDKKHWLLRHEVTKG